MKAPKTVGTILKNEVLKAKAKTNTIIGIDPGLQNLGIGILHLKQNLKLNPEIKKKKTIYHAENRAENIKGYSHILLKIKQNRNIEEKLHFVFEHLCETIQTYNPKLIIVEDAFVGINKNSALKLGLVRGAILTAIGKHKIPFQTISPKQIKMEITKKGDAQKEDIQNIFAQLLPNWQPETPFDVSDALAAAFCGIK